MHSEPVYAAPAQAGVRGIRQQERERGCVRRCGQPSRQAADTSNVFENSVLDQLDAREIDMLRLLGEGKSYTQIAAVLGNRTRPSPMHRARSERNLLLRRLRTDPTLGGEPEEVTR
jgi:DNA-binding CsgD family transcriptional regulator